MKPIVLTLALVTLGFAGLALHQGSQTGKEAMIARGKYLVTAIDCGGCHTPFKLTAQGPIPDSSRFLSGYPADVPIPPVPTEVLAPDKWLGLFSLGNAFAGPWGISFPRNLTPDTATGLGSWTENMFIKAMRTGKDMGEGRDILPPMPWQAFAQMTDNDLKAMFAYLHSLKPISNAVPDPIPPAGEHPPTGKGTELPPK